MSRCFSPEDAVRRHTLVYGWRAPAVPRPAATLVLLRACPGGLEVLLSRRSAHAQFAPGAWVFPGGTINAADHARGVDHAPSARLASAGAALRETFEELRILLARRANDERLITAPELAALERGPPHGLRPQLEERGWVLATERLALWSHWITGPDLPQRFATDFWLALMPEDQQAEADSIEQHEPRWLSPAQALEAHASGALPMLLPTQRTLMQLAEWRDAEALWRACAQPAHSVRTYCPRAGTRDGAAVRLTNDEPGHAELALVNPDGQAAHTLDWQSRTPRPLRTLVHRLTAPNAGLMTGPGTNTYIVGDARGCFIIDPGPHHPEHLARLAQWVGTSVQAIILTHAHADHAAGAEPLKQALGGAIPILGLPAAPHPGRHPGLMPTRTLHDGERLLGPDITLRVIHTPGHARHHLCLLLEEDRMLFSGDHILQGSTTVIEPPDGHMGDYLAALERLRHEAIDFILPAHGHVMGPAQPAIEALLAHRYARQLKTWQALARHGPTALNALLPQVYDDIAPARHPIAARSLRAHLEWLAEQGLAALAPAGWIAVGTPPTLFPNRPTP